MNEKDTDTIVYKTVSDIEKSNKHYLQAGTDIKMPIQSTIKKFKVTESKTVKAINIFVSYASNDEGEKNCFLKFLKEALNEQQIEFNLKLWEMCEIPIGIEFDSEIKKQLERCDYGFALLSESFLQSDYIMSKELKYLLDKNKLFPIGLVGNKNELEKFIRKNLKREYKKTANKLMSRNIFVSKNSLFFNKCVDDKDKKEFIENLLKDLEFRKSFDKKSNSNLKKVISNKDESYNIEVFFEHAKAEILAIKTETQKLISEHNKSTVKVLDNLFEWFDDDSKSLYALLGDYGMGKTFNLRIFAQKVYEEYKNNQSRPFPFYIDLRDVSSFIETKDGIKRVIKIKEAISEILEQSNNTDITAKDIIKMHQDGKLILIFDGLDEKLVHYTKEQQNRFFNAILSLVKYKKETQKAIKIILSCRNHYFETALEQNSYLLSQQRGNVDSKSFIVANILPLDRDEVKEFIQKRLDSIEDTNRLFEYIESDEYLGKIASRPFMLGKIVELLPVLETLKGSKQKLNSASFYKALIDDTLGRDEKKHFIAKRDKKFILKELAYYMFKNSIQKLNIDKLNNWFLKLVVKDEILKEIYDIKNKKDILEKDLRTSTLLVRFNDSDFGFSHSSIMEYFLALYTIENFNDVSKSKLPSTLTLSFMYESIDSLDKLSKDKLFRDIVNTMPSYNTDWIKVALNILSKLNMHIDSLSIDSANLEEFKFYNLNIKNLKLYKCNLYQSRWQECDINKLILKNSNLNESYFFKTDIKKIENIDSKTSDMTQHKSIIKC